jgi:hypothetical protein
MIWLFDKGGQQLKYEVCRRDEGDGFLLVVTAADGRTRTERVDQPTELIERTVTQLKQLREDGWKIG